MFLLFSPFLHVCAVEFLHLFIVFHALFFVGLGNLNMVMALAGNKSDLLDAKKVASEASISLSHLIHFTSRLSLSLLRLGSAPLHIFVEFF